MSFPHSSSSHWPGIQGAINPEVGIVASRNTSRRSPLLQAQGAGHETSKDPSMWKGTVFIPSNLSCLISSRPVAEGSQAANSLREGNFLPQSEELPGGWDEPLLISSLSCQPAAQPQMQAQSKGCTTEGIIKPQTSGWKTRKGRLKEQESASETGKEGEPWKVTR